MWELDCKESWAPKNWCFWTVVLEKTLESPSDCKEIQPVHSKGNQSWIFIGRTDAEAETPILWPPDWCEEPTHWKRPWCRGRLRAGGEGDKRGWNSCMASPTLWTWVWVSFGSWWTGKPGMLQSWGHRVRHVWVNELNTQNWSETLRKWGEGIWKSWELDLSGETISGTMWVKNELGESRDLLMAASFRDEARMVGRISNARLTRFSNPSSTTY